MDVLVDAYGCTGPLRDEMAMASLISDLVSMLDMNVLYGPKVLFYDGGAKPADEGVTGFVVIAESHIAIHTFSARRFAQVTVSSCRALDRVAIADFLRERLGAAIIGAQAIDRGLDHAEHVGLAPAVDHNEPWSIAGRPMPDVEALLAPRTVSGSGEWHIGPPDLGGGDGRADLDYTQHQYGRGYSKMPDGNPPNVA